MIGLDSAQIDYVGKVLGLRRILLPAEISTLSSLREPLPEKFVETRGGEAQARMIALLPLSRAHFPLHGPAEALLQKMFTAMKLGDVEVMMFSWIATEENPFPEVVREPLMNFLEENPTASRRTPIVLFGDPRLLPDLPGGDLGRFYEWNGGQILVTYSPQTLLDSPDFKRMAWVHLQTVMKLI